MERGVPGRSLVFYPNFWVLRCTLHISPLPAMQSCHGSAMQCITTVHHHSASRCLPSWWRSAVPGTVLSLLLSAAFNPLLPFQTLTASEAIDISFNIQRANSTSIQLLHGFSCCTVLASSFQYKPRYIKWKTSRSLYCFAILISAFNQGESPS